MSELIPSFDFQAVFIVPWQEDFQGYFLIATMGFLISLSCGLIGNFIMLRRMALIGDAISHSVLPGLAVALFLSKSLATTAMFIGALVAGILTTVLIELIHQNSRVKPDAAIGIVFTSLFALGVILINVYAGEVHLDTECVLYGEIAFIPFEPLIDIGGREWFPGSVLRMGGVTLLVILGIVLFYKELLVTSFDPGLSVSLGISTRTTHYLLMGLLSLVIVSAFQSVGAILVIAMLILPGATASMLCSRLPAILWLTAGLCLPATLAGIHLSIWLDCSMAGAMVIASAVFFILAWLFSPRRGLLQQLIQKVRLPEVHNLTLDNSQE
ncbi:MAG TPA: metal ABC transporter permease [Verrucomicrobiales bacterium]|jgi:manganese/zinc/iron transport system permease protein|nr:metal ABC transporter permease [Verrucomicrobiales bacterium]HIL70266.1 metal ABC transporter permease [Verrucomicrobiota bacterium]